MGEHFRVFPISNWTELDVWQYIMNENIKLPDFIILTDVKFSTVTEFILPGLHSCSLNPTKRYLKQMSAAVQLVILPVPELLCQKPDTSKK